MTATDSSIATARHAARAAAEKLAEDIIAMDVSERLALADIFLKRALARLGVADPYAGER